MQPLGLPHDIHWRVMRVDRIVAPSGRRKYHMIRVTFQKFFEGNNKYPKSWNSDQFKVTHFNISQIKYFPIGSIWKNDQLVRGVDYFEKFTIRKSCLFEDSTLVFDEGDYLEAKNLPYTETNSKIYPFPSPLAIYENEKKFTLEIGKESYKASFIAFPCYEIARYFLLSVGTYNERIINSDLMNDTGNRLFKNSSVSILSQANGEQFLHMQLRIGVPYARYRNVADLASSECFRKEAMKMQGYHIADYNPFTGIELPIKFFSKMSFYAKRVKRKRDEAWGLLIIAIADCTGFRNYSEVEVDHEDENKKRIKEKPEDDYEDWENDDDDPRLQTINTGDPTEYDDNGNTNNNLSPLIEEVSDLMSLFNQDSENIPFTKITVRVKSKRPTGTILNEIEANKKALMTLESDNNGDIQPIVFDENVRTKYNPQGTRDESEDSFIYEDRYFQDIHKIVNLLVQELKKEIAENEITIDFANKHLNFDSNFNRFELRHLSRGHDPNYFLRSNTKRQRNICIVQIKLRAKYFYLVETEFKSDKSTNSTTVFHKNSFSKCTKDNLTIFFNHYIAKKGVVSSILKVPVISNTFQLHYIEHPITDRSTQLKFTVKEAFGRYVRNIVKKIIQ